MTRPDEILDIVSLVSLAALCVLALRKLVLMDGLLGPRVLILSIILWLPVFYLFTLGFRGGCGCEDATAEAGAFTCTEMSAAGPRSRARRVSL